MAVVQTITGNAGATSVAFPSPLTVGNTLILFRVSWWNVAGGSDPTNSLTQDTGFINVVPSTSGPDRYVAIWRQPITAGGSSTITVPATGDNLLQWCCIEVEGNLGVQLDAVSNAASSYGSPTTMTINRGQQAPCAKLEIAGISIYADVANMGLTTPSGWTRLHVNQNGGNAGGGPGVEFIYRYSSSTESPVTWAALGVDNYWSIAAVIFTDPASPAASYKFYPDDKVFPTEVDATGPTRLGMTFDAREDSKLTAVRIYAPSYSGTVNLDVGAINAYWTSNSTLIQQITDPGGTITVEGWYEYEFTTPIDLVANTRYTVSYDSDGTGRFPVQRNVSFDNITHPLASYLSSTITPNGVYGPYATGMPGTQGGTNPHYGIDLVIESLNPPIPPATARRRVFMLFN